LENDDKYTKRHRTEDLYYTLDRIHCYKKQTIQYTIHNDELNE